MGGGDARRTVTQVRDNRYFRGEITRFNLGSRLSGAVHRRLMTSTPDDPPDEGAWTAHLDTFVRDRLPPRETQPTYLFDLPELRYPSALNAARVLIDDAGERGWGGRTAIHTDAGSWSYARLLEAANRMAGALVHDLSLEPGGRVLLRLANSPALVAAWLAVLKAGGIVVTTMPMLRAGELHPIIEKARIDIGVADDGMVEDLHTAADGQRPAPRILPLSEFEGLAARRPPTFATVRTHRDDAALLAFTSGTTGRPKACVHFHRDVLAMADTFARHVLRPHEDDIFVATPPMAFTYGLGGGLVFPLRFGAATSFPAVAGPDGLMQHIERHKVSVLFAAPTGYRQMLARQPTRGLGSLRLCVSAGEPLDRATSDAWHGRTGLRLIDGIGATEMIHIFISAAGDDIRPGATGKPVPGYEAAILDQQGRQLPPGEAGRLAVRGPTGCRYLDDERQAAYVVGGWNITGDTYRQDADGYFWFVARADDMIVSSGYNIAGPEVEAALLAHPAVAECAVVAHPDVERGHIAKAYIVLAAPPPDDEAGLVRELQHFVKAAIAPYKYPRAIEFVADLPKTPTGKIQRYRLRGGRLSGTTLTDA